MVCHGELARLKPSPRHLTEFYLLIAAGGALGGLFVGIVAPLVFSTYFRMADRRRRVGRAQRRAAGSAAVEEERRHKRDAGGTKSTQTLLAKPSRNAGIEAKIPAVSVPAGNRRPSRSFADPRGAVFVCAAAVALLYLAFWVAVVQRTLDRARNFFGVVSVSDLYAETPSRHDASL